MTKRYYHISAVAPLLLGVFLAIPASANLSGVSRADTAAVRAIADNGGGRSLISGGNHVSYFSVGAPVAGRTILAPKSVSDGLTAFLVGQHDTAPPFGAGLSSPAQNTETVSTQITFTWSLGSDSSPPISYRLLVDTDMAGLFAVDTTVVDSYSITATLRANDTYSWRIIASDVRGESVTIGDSRLRIYTLTPPGLTSPINGAETQASSIRFSWTAGNSSGPSIKDYRLQASDSTSFDTPILDIYHNASSTETIPLYLFSSWDTFYWRMASRTVTDQAGSWSGIDSFLRVQSKDTQSPLTVDNFMASGLDSGAIRLAWDRSPSPDVFQYNLFWDSGLGTYPDTLLSVIPHSETSYVHFTSPLVSGREYRFSLTTQDSGGNQGPAVLASVTARSAAPTTANALLASPEGGAKLKQGDSAIQILATLEGTPAQIAAVSTLTFQYRRSGDTTWSAMTAASGVAGNANPITLANAADELGNYRFLWNSSTVASETYELRSLVTATTGETSGTLAAGVSVRLVNAAVESPTVITQVLADGFQVEQILNANRSETLILYNNPETQALTLYIPSGSFPNAVDSANVYANVSLRFTNSFDTALTRDFIPVGDAATVTITNGDTALSGGNIAFVTLTFHDDNQDGFVDNTRARWNNLKIYRHPGTAGGAWEALTTIATQNPTATTAGWIRARTERFSVFRLVGVGASASLANFMVTPNPFRPNDGNPATGQNYTGAAGTGVYFLNLPTWVYIQVYTVAGRKVFGFETRNSTGQIQWDAKNEAGRDVASGVYVFTVEDLATGERKSGKLAVIR